MEAEIILESTMLFK